MNRRRGRQTPWHLHGWNTAAVVGLARWGLAHFPRWLSDTVSHVGSGLAFHVMRAETAALMANLQVVRPELGWRELRALALRTYRNYAAEQADFFRSLSMSPRELASFLSPDSAFRPTPRDGNGLLVVTGHLGNVELGGILLRVLFDYPLAAVMLPEPDPRVHEMRRQIRAAFGIDSLEVGGGVDTALRIRRLLAEDGVVAVVADRPLGRDRVEVEFFGRATGFLRSPALIGYMTGAPLVPSFILRQPDGRYIGVAGSPIRVPHTGDRNENVRMAMQAFATALEQQVRAYPHLWYQFYPYWSEESGR